MKARTHNIGYNSLLHKANLKILTFNWLDFMRTISVGNVRNEIIAEAVVVHLIYQWQ